MSFFDTTGNLSASASANHLRQGFSEATERFRAQAWTREASLIAVASLYRVLRSGAACWLLSETVVPWDFQKPLLSDVSFSRRRLAARRDSAVEPLSFCWPSGGRRSAIPAFHASMALFALIAPNASMQLFDAVIFAHLAAGGLCVLGPVPALALASGGRCSRGADLHAGGRRLLAAAAHRHDNFLFLLSRCAMESRDRARASILSIRASVRGMRRADGARPRSSRLFAMHGSRRTRHFAAVQSGGLRLFARAARRSGGWGSSSLAAFSLFQRC